MNYNDNWRFLNQLIDMKIGEKETNLKAYWVKVLTSDGYYASVKFATSETSTLPIPNVPILQSKYHTPIVMPGDEGLLLNLHQNLDPQLSGKTSQEIRNTNYYVFLPLISKANYKGAFNKQRISNSLLNTYIELADDGVTLESVQKLDITAKETTIASESSLEITSQKVSLESSGNLTIKASSPIEFGTSQTLGKALDDLCSALASFKTLPVSQGTPAAADPKFITKITQVQAALAQILKS